MTTKFTKLYESVKQTISEAGRRPAAKKASQLQSFIYNQALKHDKYPVVIMLNKNAKFPKQLIGSKHSANTWPVSNIANLEGDGKITNLINFKGSEAAKKKIDSEAAKLFADKLKGQDSKQFDTVLMYYPEKIKSVDKVITDKMVDLFFQQAINKRKQWMKATMKKYTPEVIEQLLSKDDDEFENTLLGDKVSKKVIPTMLEDKRFINYIEQLDKKDKMNLFKKFATPVLLSDEQLKEIAKANGASVDDDLEEFED